MLTRTLLALFIGLLLVVTEVATAQKAHTFAIAEGQFLYGGQPVQIRSGEMHYAHVPQPYWRHRLKMLKATGLNTVATYVFWHYHNPAPGVWNFSTDNHNLAEFVKTAQQEGLFVILRPGPYACAEWKFGGYPWWLQQNKDLVIRANNQPFLDSCRAYINKLADQIKPVSNDTLLPFEALRQGSGYVLYSRPFTQPMQGTLEVAGLRDFATVYVNGKKVSELNRIDKQYELVVDIPFNGTLELLVENMERINYGAKINQNIKGIISPIFIDNLELTGDWMMYRLPLNRNTRPDYVPSQTGYFQSTDVLCRNGYSEAGRRCISGHA